MSHQQSEKQSFPYTTQNWIAFARLVVKLCSFTFCTALSLSTSITVRKPKSSPTQNWIALENCWLPTTSQLHVFSLHNLVTSCFNNFNNFNTGILASGKTRIVPKTSKFTTAWWLASNSKNMPRCFLRGAKFTNKNDQWSSAARVSASRSTNPWYMTHRVLPLTIREPRQVCLNCAGLRLWVVWGFRTVQIPLAVRHWYSRAQHSWINYQNSGQEITSKTNTEPPKCHWLSATGFQRVQNPGPNKIQNESKSCSRQTTTSTKRMVSRDLTIQR